MSAAETRRITHEARLILGNLSWPWRNGHWAEDWMFRVHRTALKWAQPTGRTPFATIPFATIDDATGIGWSRVRHHVVRAVVRHHRPDAPVAVVAVIARAVIAELELLGVSVG